MDDGLEALQPVNVTMPVLYIPPPTTTTTSVSSKGPSDLHGAVAVGQAPPRLHDLAAALPVLPAAPAGAPLLRADLPPPEATQVTTLLFRSIYSRRGCKQSLQRPQDEIPVG